MAILARFLRDRGIVTERQLQEAIHHQVLYGGRLGTSLYELGFITEDRLQEALSRVHGVQAMRVDPLEISPDVVTLLPKKLAADFKIFPYKLKGKTLFLLMVDPSDHSAVAKVGFSLGYIVKPVVVPEFRMIQLLKDYYGVDERWRFVDVHRTPQAQPQTMDLPTALAAFERAESRDEVVAAVLALCQQQFKRVIFFIVREPWVLGWNGAGEGMDKPLAESLKVPLDQPSVFRTVARDKTVFIGRFGPEEVNQRFLGLLSKKPTTNAALFPIAIKGRVVNLIYGDNGPTGNIKGNIGELLVTLQRVSRSYLRIIRRRIAETEKEMGAQASAEKEIE
ncbi:MAG: hypothetical protein MUF51_04160 [Vicinamibacteria bacterium]|jgi:hypothetical protein|nr:hypothetical protein [Vicinamibacteria bacterium]